MRCRHTWVACATFLTMAKVFAQAAAGPDEPGFVLQSVQFDGAAVVEARRLQAAVAPLLGRVIRFADLEAARQTLEAIHHEAGWRLVRVRLPAQRLDGANVRFEVVAPVLDTVSVAADTPDTGRWRAALPALREGQVPNLAELDRQLSLANEQGSQQLQVAMALPSAGGGKTLHAEIQARTGEPSGWVAFADNSGNDATGRLRYGVAWRHARLFDTDQQINLQVVSAPHDADHPSRVSLLPSRKVRIVGLGWRMPFPDRAAAMDATLGYSSVDSGQLQDLFKVTGRGSTAQVRYTQLLYRQGGWEPRAFVAFDWRRYDNQTEFGGFRLGQPLVLSPLSLGFSAVRPATPQRPTAVSAYAAVLLNLPAGRHADEANFQADRPGAQRRYRLMRAGLQTSAPWSEGVLAFSVDAQVSPHRLPSGEQFSAGGASSVRGFADRGISGDSGVRSQLEWTSGNLLTDKSGGSSLRVAGFIDAAWAARRGADLLERSRTHIASAGVGLRMHFGNWNARLDWGHAIHQNTGQAPVGGGGHVSIARRF